MPPKAKTPTKATKAAKPKATKPKKVAPTVDELLAEAAHPFHAEVQAVRAIIKAAHRDITEEWKWKAPSFSYKGDYLVTFNLWATDRVHLVFHNAAILEPRPGFLEGAYPDRRMVYLASMVEVKARKAALVTVIKEWIGLMDQKSA